MKFVEKAVLQSLKRFNAHEAKNFLDAIDWTQAWPIVDHNGELTGDFLSGDDLSAGLYYICDVNADGISAVDLQGDGKASTCAISKDDYNNLLVKNSNHTWRDIHDLLDRTGELSLPEAIRFLDKLDEDGISVIEACSDDSGWEARIQACL